MIRDVVAFVVSLTGAALLIQGATGFSFSSHQHRQPSWLLKHESHLYSIQPSESKSVDISSSSSPPSPALGAWIPIGSASSFRGLSPCPVELMGQSYVVWESQSSDPDTADASTATTSTWSVMEDICPHRLVPLSQGRINKETNCLECAYHGWQFDTNGTTTCIPQMDDSDPVAAAATAALPGPTSFPVHLTGDLIWAFFPTSLHGESFPVSLLPEEYYKGLKYDMSRNATYYTHELPFSWHLTLENGLDPSHFPFTHHGVIGKRSDASPMPMTVALQNETHLDFQTSYMRNGVPRDRRYSFQRPTLLYTQELEGAAPTNNNNTAAEAAWKPSSKFFVVPVQQGRTRLITSVEKLSKPWLPDWVTHILIGRLFVGDYFLHYAERNLPSKKYLYATQADQGVKGWQGWWKNHGMSKAPPDTFGAAVSSSLTGTTTPPLLSRREITSPWRVHTQTCSKCRSVLRRARRVQLGSLVVGLVGAILLKAKHQYQSIACVLVGLFVNRIAQRLVRALEGSPHDSDVPEKSWSMMLE